jgi:glycosyltransferase involved in cell wall biosynthesis
MQMSEVAGLEAPSSRSDKQPLAEGEGRGPRRVFFLLDSFMIGGTETQAVELARRLDPARFQVTIGCLRKEGPLLDRLKGTPVEIVKIELGRGIDSPSGILGVLKLAAYLRKMRFEVVHAHDLWSNMVGMAASMLARVPVTITSQRDLSHDAWYGTYRRRVLRFLQRRSSVVLTNAKAIRDSLVAQDGVPPEKVCVIYNGVDLDKFRNSHPHRAAMFPDSEGNKLIVLVGNMISEVKGHLVLISAAVEIVRQYPRTQFVLVGEGPKRRDFEAQVASSGLKENFLFLGRRTDVAQILGCCDIAVLPSLAEGLPNAVLEYLAAGLPVVASALGGNLEVIQDGITGLLVPAQDSPALANALTRLLDDQEFSARLARAGQEHVASYFSFERLVAEVGKLYTSQLQAATAKS